MAAPPHRVIFDDNCEFCRRCVRWLGRLDWFRRFTWAGPGSLKNHSLEHQASPAELQQAVHVFTAQGDILKAARAMRFITLRLPLTAPAAAALFLPGALLGAERLYRRLSRHRHRLLPDRGTPSCDSCQS